MASVTSTSSPALSTARIAPVTAARPEGKSLTHVRALQLARAPRPAPPGRRGRRGHRSGGGRRRARRPWPSAPSSPSGSAARPSSAGRRAACRRGSAASPRAALAPRRLGSWPRRRPACPTSSRPTRSRSRRRPARRSRPSRASASARIAALMPEPQVVTIGRPRSTPAASNAALSAPAASACRPPRPGRTRERCARPACGRRAGRPRLRRLAAEARGRAGVDQLRRAAVQRRAHARPGRAPARRRKCALNSPCAASRQPASTGCPSASHFWQPAVEHEHPVVAHGAEAPPHPRRREEADAVVDDDLESGSTPSRRAAVAKSAGAGSMCGRSLAWSLTSSMSKNTAPGMWRLRVLRVRVAPGVRHEPAGVEDHEAAARPAARPARRSRPADPAGVSITSRQGGAGSPCSFRNAGLNSLL